MGMDDLGCEAEDYMDELDGMMADDGEADMMCAAPMGEMMSMKAMAAPMKMSMDACEDLAEDDSHLDLMMMMDAAPAKSKAMAPAMMMAAPKSSAASGDKYFLEAVKCTVKQVKKKQAAAKCQKELDEEAAEKELEALMAL
jgi:hypothetical protein